MKEKNLNKITETTKQTKQTRLSQTFCPLVSIKEILRIPQAIKDDYAGQPTSPLLVAESCGISPTSSNWRTLTGAAVAYGLTNGGYNSKNISLTELGERIVAPMVEGDDLVALRESIMKPTLFAEIYSTYNGNKLPKNNIAYNILAKKGVSKEKQENTWQIIKDNANEAKILRIISGNEFICLEANSNQSSRVIDNETDIETNFDLDNQEELMVPNELLEKMSISTPACIEKQTGTEKRKPNIFISHGKNNTVIVGQLKELLAYGQMEPVVSIERETTAIPVPDKVFDDMRNCDAGIIHIDFENVPINNGENAYERINENVLIEIGAAIALYGKRVILLCKKGTTLPSNLQGLYRCEYEGNQLDYNSTMKLLKTMQELRALM